jgi:hypothetical protein
MLEDVSNTRVMGQRPFSSQHEREREREREREVHFRMQEILYFWELIPKANNNLLNNSIKKKTAGSC